MCGAYSYSLTCELLVFGHTTLVDERLEDSLGSNLEVFSVEFEFVELGPTTDMSACVDPPLLPYRLQLLGLMSFVWMSCFVYSGGVCMEK